VYEEPHDNLYAHHDIPLPVFPLCLAWMDFRPRPALLSQPEAAAAPRSNMLAVGTFAPFIEIWDLDVIDVLEPVAVLGAEGAQAALDAQDGAAADAVRRQNRKGDGEAKKEKKTKKKKGGAGVEGHTDAVMALAWGHLRRNVLASGSADHTVRVCTLCTHCWAPSLPPGAHADPALPLR
jgi:periodic tryptophan protein 1